MTAEVSLLVFTAFSVGFLHTILGPNHYIPFVAMSRSNKWTARKTALITALCGVGHVVGSVLIGAIGLLFGTLIFQIESVESFRGESAAWLLIGFGIAYLTWGIVRAVRDIPHTHLHSHVDGTVHTHLHKHDLEHRHVHDSVDVKEEIRSNSEQSKKISLTPWILFLIFAFGPCEVLIPLLMYPAAEANAFAIVAVVAAFSIATVATMVASVMLLVYGMNFVKLPNLHRFSHAVAGFAVLLCGLMVKFGL